MDFQSKVINFDSKKHIYDIEFNINSSQHNKSTGHVTVKFEACKPIIDYSSGSKILGNELQKSLTNHLMKTIIDFNIKRREKVLKTIG